MFDPIFWLHERRCPGLRKILSHRTIIPCKRMWFLIPRQIWVHHLVRPILAYITPPICSDAVNYGIKSRHWCINADVDEMRSPECLVASAYSNAAISRGCGSGVWSRRQCRGKSQQLPSAPCVMAPTLPLAFPLINYRGIHDNDFSFVFFLQVPWWRRQFWWLSRGGCATYRGGIGGPWQKKWCQWFSADIAAPRSYYPFPW